MAASKDTEESGERERRRWKEVDVNEVDEANEEEEEAEEVER